MVAIQDNYIEMYSTHSEGKSILLRDWLEL